MRNKGDLPPTAGECGFANQELGLAQATGGDSPRRVRHLLKDCLGRDPIGDTSLEGGVQTQSKLIDQELVDEGGVADPGVSGEDSQ